MEVRTSRSVVRAGGVSDVGRVRETNEDMFVSDPDMRLFAVADGMGGHSAGEVASRVAIETITTFIRQSASTSDFWWPYDFDRTLSLDGNRLRTAILLANHRVFHAAETTDEYRGMGTTIVAALVNSGRMSIGHVGDSRFYLLSNGMLHQLTRDDSWAATILAQDPNLDSAQIARHAMRNVLTNVLGAREQIDIHLTEREVEGDEVMLLCSDGLHGVLDDDALKEILISKPDVDEAARALVDAAINHGSRDNITAVVVRCDGDLATDGSRR